MTPQLFKSLAELMPSESNQPYKLCRIADSNGDLTKPWYVEFYAFDAATKKLRRKRVVLNHATAKERYKEGKLIKAEIDEALQKGAVINRQPSKNVHEVKETTKITDALAYYINFQSTILKERTLETYRTDIKRFEEFLTRHDLQKITISDFTNSLAYHFLDELKVVKKLSNRSRNNTKGTITSFFNFFRKRKIITENPFDDIEKLPSIATKHSAFSDFQVQEFKKICLTLKEKQLWLFIHFMHFGFIRPRQELRFLKVGDIKKTTIQVIAENAKTSYAQHILIPPPLNRIIDEYKIRSFNEDYYVFGVGGVPGPEPLGRDFIYERHRKILALCDFETEKKDLYSWKHTGVIALFRATQNIELIRQQCRHTDIATTQKYLRDLGCFIDYDQINKFPEI